MCISSATFRTFVIHLIKYKDYIDVNQSEKGFNSVRPGSKNTTVREDKAKRLAGEGMGTTTVYDFSDKKKAELKASIGVKETDESIVSHELKHKHDFYQGKMADRNGEGANDPSEQTAVKNENIWRKRNNMKERTKYGGEEIDPFKLK